MFARPGPCPGGRGRLRLARCCVSLVTHTWNGHPAGRVKVLFETRCFREKQSVCCVKLDFGWLSLRVRGVFVVQQTFQAPRAHTNPFAFPVPLNMNPLPVALLSVEFWFCTCLYLAPIIQFNACCGAAWGAQRLSRSLR